MPRESRKLMLSRVVSEVIKSICENHFTTGNQADIDTLEGSQDVRACARVAPVRLCVHVYVQSKRRKDETATPEMPPGLHHRACVHARCACVLLCVCVRRRAYSPVVRRMSSKNIENPQNRKIQLK
jgi:hypothetical protein